MLLPYRYTDMWFVVAIKPLYIMHVLPGVVMGKRKYDFVVVGVV